MFPLRLTPLSLMMIILLSGCGKGGPRLASVSGVVTLNGKPVPHATITFVPQNASPRSPSYGQTDSAGHYTLKFSRDRNGAIPADHLVQIATEKPGKNELRELKEAAAAGGPPVPEFIAIPKKYQTVGALTASVREGRNEINFELTTEMNSVSQNKKGNR